MINFSNINLSSLNSLKQEVAHRFTDQQKKIAVIVLFALGCLASANLFYRCCFKAQPSDPNDDDEIPSRGFLGQITDAFQQVKMDQISKLLKEADQAIKRKAYDEADVKFQEALKANPQNVKSLTSYGIFLSDHKKNDKAAQDYFDRALTQDPKNAELMIIYAKSLLNQDLADQAVDHLKEALKLGPRNYRALIQYTRALLMQGKINEAQDEIDKALILAPTAPSTHMLKGDILFAMGDFSGADSWYEKWINLDSRSPEGDLGITLLILYEKGKHQAVLALKLCQQLIHRRRHASQLEHFAVELHLKGCLDDAAVVFDMLVKQDPQSVFSLSRIADILCHQGRTKEAIRLFNKAYSIDPTDSYMLERYGYAYVKDNQLAAADKRFKEAIKLNPDNMFALKYHAYILSEEGNLSSSLPIFEKVLKFAPEDNFTLRHYADVLFKLDRFQKALGIYEKILELDPHDAHALKQADVARQALI